MVASSSPRSWGWYERQPKMLSLTSGYQLALLSEDVKGAPPPGSRLLEDRGRRSILPRVVEEPEIQIPRALAEVDLRRVPVLFSDVLVVGSGVAGISAAVEAAERGSVALVAK